MNTVSQNTRYAALLSMLDSALDAIISIDADGRILTFNPAAERMFGHDADAVVGKPLRTLMTGPDAERHDAYVHRYMRTGKAHIIGKGREVECQRKDGSRFFANLTVSESMAGGQRIFTGILHDLTTRRAVQARAAALGDIIEHSGNAIYVIDRETRRIVYANEAAREAWDHARDISGQPIGDAFEPIDVEALSGAMADMEQGRARTVDLRVRARRADGTAYAADVHLFSGIYGGDEVVVASMNDVSEQEQVELELRRTQLEQTLILRYAPIGIVLLDRAGRVLSANDAALRICGTTEDTMVGSLGIHYLADADKRQVRRQFLTLISGHLPYTTSTHGLVRADGKCIPVRTYNAIVSDGRIRDPILITMFEDLSEERAREAELNDQRERLAHVGRLSQMGEMAAGLAHELNQPLAAISAYASAGQRLVDENESDQRIASAFERIAQQSRRAGDVIRKIRSLATREDAQREIIGINAIIRGLLTLVEIDMRHTGARLTLSLDNEAAVLADRVQIEQVLLNFVRNAIDACRDLPSERRGLTIATGRVGDAARVEVADRGPGVDADIKARLFDPFVSGKSEGMGMGLSISKSIIEAHGGTIGVEDRAPHGAVFWFTLPLAAAGDEAA